MIQQTLFFKKNITCCCGETISVFNNDWTAIICTYCGVIIPNPNPPKTAFEKLISEKEKVVGCLSLARSGNAFDLMFYVESKLKNAGWSSKEIKIVLDQAMDSEAAKKMGMAGYDFLLTILQSVLTVEGTIAEPIDDFLKRHGWSK